MEEFARVVQILGIVGFLVLLWACWEMWKAIHQIDEALWKTQTSLNDLYRKVYLIEHPERRGRGEV